MNNKARANYLVYHFEKMASAAQHATAAEEEGLTQDARQMRDDLINHAIEVLEFLVKDSGGIT